MSDYDLVEFEDLELLDGGDLRAVFEQVGHHQVLDALVGARPAVRQLLMTKLPKAIADTILEEMNNHGPVTVEAARLGQQACVDMLCRLSRGGIIAYDHPADMMVA